MQQYLGRYSQADNQHGIEFCRKSHITQLVKLYYRSGSGSSELELQSSDSLN